MKALIVKIIIIWLAYGAGFWLIWSATSWHVSVGVFIVLFASNLEKSNTWKKNT